MASLYTPRLELRTVSLDFVEAVILGDRARAERAAGMSLPPEWPNRDLVARAFSFSIDEIRADPERRLWGDRLMIPLAGEPRVVGSVVFHGRPDGDGVAEVGYGVEASMQRQGLATEAVCACVDWALAQPGVRAVRATTFEWHVASVRVLEKAGMRRVDWRTHELFGELPVFERRRDGA